MSSGFHVLRAAVLTGQLLLSGCLGAAAYVAYPGSQDIPNPKVFSYRDESTGRSLEYCKEKLPRADRVEVEGGRTTLYYDDLGVLLGGPVVIVSPGVVLPLYLPIPMGREKLSLTFQDGTLVSARKTVARASGFLFIYYPLRNHSTSLADGMRPDAVFDEFSVRVGVDVAGEAP